MIKIKKCLTILPLKLKIKRCGKLTKLPEASCRNQNPLFLLKSPENFLENFRKKILF